MKKFMKVMCTLAIALFGVTACTGKSTQQLQEAKCPIKIGLVTDMNGIDDMSINQESWNAISSYAKDSNLSVSCYSYLQATSESDFVPFLSQMGEDGMDIVIVPGSTIGNALTEVSLNYPSTSFVVVDSVVEASNVVSIKFATDSPMYLAGVTVALKAVDAQATKVAYVGNDESSFNEVAFKEGVAFIDPALEVRSSYVGELSVEDTQKVVHDLYNEGVYIIYTDSMNKSGVYNEASIRRSNGEDVWIVDLSEELPVEEAYISSVLVGVSQDINTVIKNCIKERKALTLMKEGIKTIHIGNDTGYSLVNTHNLTPEILATISEVNEKIINGEIVIGSSIVESNEENIEKE